jgi:ankyrin repeat protein/F-box associated protein
MSFNNVNDFMGGSWNGPIIEEVDENATATTVPQTQPAQQVVASRGIFATIAGWFTQPAPVTPFYDLPDECVTVIVHNLSQFEWSSFALVCKRTNGVVQKLFLQVAWGWGFTGESIPEAIQYRQELYQELSSCSICFDLTIWSTPRTPKDWFTLNISILSKPTQANIIDILKCPCIYHLEKAKKILKKTIQTIHQWDPSGITDVESQATFNLIMGYINNDQEFVNLAYKLGAAPNERMDFKFKINFMLNTCYRTSKMFCLIRDQISHPLWLKMSDKEGRMGYQASPLHYLIYLNPKPEMVSALLENGADPTIADQVGDTPLHSAMLYGHYEIAHLLLEHDAQVNTPNHSGQTPFYFACLYLKHKLAQNQEITAADRQFIYQLRITYGADWDAADRWGKTPGSMMRAVAAQSNGQFQLPDELQQQDPDE